MIYLIVHLRFVLYNMLDLSYSGCFCLYWFLEFSHVSNLDRRAGNQGELIIFNEYGVQADSNCKKQTNLISMGVKYCNRFIGDGVLFRNCYSAQ